MDINPNPIATFSTPFPAPQLKSYNPETDPLPSIVIVKHMSVWPEPRICFPLILDEVDELAPFGLRFRNPKRVTLELEPRIVNTLVDDGVYQGWIRMENIWLKEPGDMSRARTHSTLSAVVTPADADGPEMIREARFVITHPKESWRKMVLTRSFLLSSLRGARTEYAAYRRAMRALHLTSSLYNERACGSYQLRDDCLAIQERFDKLLDRVISHDSSTPGVRDFQLGSIRELSKTLDTFGGGLNERLERQIQETGLQEASGKPEASNGVSASISENPAPKGRRKRQVVVLTPEEYAALEGGSGTGSSNDSDGQS